MTLLLLPVGMVAQKRHDGPERVISGTVVDDDRAPVPGVRVVISQIDSTHPSLRKETFTNSEGRFRFIVPAGRWRLTIQRMGYAASSFETDVSEHDVRVTVPLSSSGNLGSILSEVVPLPGGYESPNFNLWGINYFLFGFAGSSDDRADGVYAEQVKFRVGLRYRIGTFERDAPIKLGRMRVRGATIMASYSQRSFWHLYDESAPFFDNNYSPGIVAVSQLAKDTTRSSLTLTLGVNHESNGRRAAASRGWNRLAVGLGIGRLMRDRVSASVTAWRPWGVEEGSADLPDYAGHGELDFYWHPVRPVNEVAPYTVNLRARLAGKRLVPATEINVVANLPRCLRLNPSLMVQYFDGYAENLLLYRNRQRVFRVGFGVLQ